MSDTMVTLHGWVGSDVTFNTFGDTPVATFRVGSTPRIKRKGQWEDGETAWYSVSAWRGLADNVRESLHRGDAVIVHGRLRTRTYQSADSPEERRISQVDAILIGHDLSRGTSAFLKNQRPENATVDVDSEVAAMIAAGVEDDEPIDTWGNPRATPESAPAPEGDKELAPF